MEIKIEGDTTLLNDLRKELSKKLGKDSEVRDVISTAPGELREPVLVSIVVALGGPAVVTGVVKIIQERSNRPSQRSYLEILL